MHKRYSALLVTGAMLSLASTAASAHGIIDGVAGAFQNFLLILPLFL